MARKPTVYDVAREADVSIATVSRVLRTPERVRPETRQTVLEAINLLGYLPSGSARSLAARRTNTIGLFLPNIDQLDQIGDFELVSEDAADIVFDPPHAQENNSDSLYFDEVLRGCELESWRQGLSLMVSIGLKGKDGDIPQLINSMSEKVDGLIVLARSVPDSVLAFLRKRLPVVMIANAPVNQESEFDLVRVSNRKGMYTLVRHLFEKHQVRRMAYMTGMDDSPDNGKRYEGFCEGLKSEGLDPSAAPIYRGQFSQSVAYRIAASLARQGTLPQALVCANDQMALGVLRALSDAGISVPDQVIVTGFDGIKEASVSQPRLTTVRQPMVDLGRAAVSTLVRRLGSPDGPPISTELPVQVQLRESCEGTMA